jgi:hypothetical protein
MGADAMEGVGRLFPCRPCLHIESTVAKRRCFSPLQLFIILQACHDGTQA